MQVFSDFNELKAAVGTEVGASDWIEITRDRISEIEGGRRPACVAEVIGQHYR